jgi:hypothetical protein
MIVVHMEFFMKPLAKIDGCVVDGFDLEVIVEIFVPYVLRIFSSDTQINRLESFEYLFFSPRV